MGRKCSVLKRSKTVRIFRLKAYTTRNLSEVMGLYTAEKFKMTNSKSFSKNEKSNIESSILPPLNSNINSNCLKFLEAGDKKFDEAVTIPNFYLKVLEDGDRKFETSVAFSSLGLALAWVTILKIILLFIHVANSRHVVRFSNPGGQAVVMCSDAGTGGPGGATGPPNIKQIS